MTGAAARRVVLHADDVGMCHGANVAFAELSRFGTISCGSVMVPCPWFIEAAEMAAADPELDLGVHLTLTAEKQHYKWRPLTAPPRSAGLTDANGFLPDNVSALREKAESDAVEAELRAQIDAALATGADITHLDDHMGAVLTPEFLDIYIRIGLDYRLPILLTPSLSTYGPIHNIPDVEDRDYREGVARARAAGFAIFDRVLETSWERPRGETEAAYRAIVDAAKPGLSFMALHPNAPGDVETIEPESAWRRIDEYRLFGSAAYRDYLAGQDIEIVGMRGFRDKLRAKDAVSGQRPLETTQSGG
jgi:chitin disaccharide deacetylase